MNQQHPAPYNPYEQSNFQPAQHQQPFQQITRAFQSIHPAWMPRPKNGVGNAALVCGIIGAALGIIPFVGYLVFPLFVLATIFGCVGLTRTHRGEATNRATAIAGIVLGLVSLGLFVLGNLVLFAGAVA